MINMHARISVNAVSHPLDTVNSFIALEICYSNKHLIVIKIPYSEVKV